MVLGDGDLRVTPSNGRRLGSFACRAPRGRRQGAEDVGRFVNNAAQQSGTTSYWQIGFGKSGICDASLGENAWVSGDYNNPFNDGSVLTRPIRAF